MSRLCPAAIAARAAPRRSGAANEFEAEAAKNAGKSFRVFVPGNDGSTGNVAVRDNADPAWRSADWVQARR